MREASFEYPDWKEDAACNGMHTFFFPPEGKLKVPADDEVIAKKFCEECPVQVECRGYVFELERATGFVFGIWAGMTHEERISLYKRRANKRISIRRTDRTLA